MITMEKTTTQDGPPPKFDNHTELIEERLPGHHEFAKRVGVTVQHELTMQYLSGFTPREGSEASSENEEDKASMAKAIAAEASKERPGAPLVSRRKQ